MAALRVCEDLPVVAGMTTTDRIAAAEGRVLDGCRSIDLNGPR
jgi:hypothetical protein